MYRLSRQVSLILSIVLVGSLAGCDNQTPRAPLPAPQQLTATPTDGTIVLRWTAGGPAPDRYGYIVYRDTVAIVAPPAVAQRLDGIRADSLAPDTLAFVDRSPTPGTVYHYRVTAVRASGEESPPSSQVRATVFPAPVRP
ncbi:fibronectin type III domain-containing protein [Salisaeta longa]|uniref:fibronectin type III domain-containing protein n=1 Tax=Salisaeta longa TaxID=503170 RepID=UPI0003B44AEF|nr:fibronectin type III domain-containing protein [Salisaeta longa]